jgi:hypothetical protein
MASSMPDIVRVGQFSAVNINIESVYNRLEHHIGRALISMIIFGTIDKISTTLCHLVSLLCYE